MFDKLILAFEKTFIREDRYKMFLDGLSNTLIIAVCATLIGVVIGALVAIVKVYHKQTGKLKLLNSICEIYTTIIRGTPIVVQLLITYNIIFVWSTQAVAIGIMGFGINSGAYVAEIVRGGIMSIDGGQTEAARSLGLGYLPTMQLVIIPQAIKNILPSLGNELITLMKETSIVTVIGLGDLTKGATIIQGRTFEAFMPLIAAALIYLLLVIFLSWLMEKLERRMRAGDRR